MNILDLFSTFKDAGIEYSIRTNTRGQEYIGFNWVNDAAKDSANETMALTFLVDHQVLRVTLHDLPYQFNLAIKKRADLLTIGALYQVPEMNKPAISFGLFLGENTLNKNDLFSLLSYIEHCSDFLLNNTIELPKTPKFEAATHLLLDDLQSIFSELGHATKLLENSLEISIATPEKNNYRLTLSSQSGWIIGNGVRDKPSPIIMSKDQTDIYQNLQRWSTSGCLYLDQVSQVNTKIAVPLLNINPKRSAIWSASQLVAMLQTAAQRVLS